jgi:hypothetical protein
VNEDRPPADEAEAPPAEPPPEEERERLAEEPAPGRRVPLGRLIFGLVLVGIGVIWLLQALDVVAFSFLAVLPAALIVVGVVLIGAARTGRHSPLIVLGVILTVILTIASGFDIRLQGGAGERTERPATAADLEPEYRLSLGQLTLDLRNVALTPGADTRVEASVGMGQLTVRVPDDIGLAIVATAHAGAGQVALFDRESSGVDVDLSVRLPQLRPGQPVPTPVYTLTLDLSVGLGQIEVSR